MLFRKKAIDSTRLLIRCTSSFLLEVFRILDIWVKKIERIQYGPKIIHAQEVAQEVLVLQEHASGKKKLNCSLSERSSKRKKFRILSARSCKKLRVLLQTANNCKKFTVP